MNYLDQANQDLQDEQEADKRRQIIAAIGRALGTSASAQGLARVGKTTDTSVYDTISSNSSKSVSDAIANKRAAAKEQAKLEADAQEANRKAITQQLQDKTEQEAKAQEQARRAAKDAADAAAKAQEFDLKKQELELKKQDSAANRSAKAAEQQALRDAKQETVSTKAQLAQDVQFAKEEATKASEGGDASIQKNLGLLKNAQSQLQGSKEGGLFDRVQGALTKTFPTATSVIAPGTAKLQKDIESAIQGTLKPILGSAYTEAEGQRILGNAYDAALGDDVNAQRLIPVIQELETLKANKDKAAEYFRQKGTLAGFSPEAGVTSSAPKTPLSSSEQEELARLKAKYGR